STDGANQDLTRNFAKTIYNNTPALKSAEITGRHGDIQINPDGTKTMVVGGEKMIYQWNADLDIVTQQTEESKRVGEILKGLKLGGANSEGSSDTIDIDSIPDTLNSKQVDTKISVGSGTYKTVHDLKNQPDLLVLLLKSSYEALEIEEEIRHLEQLDSLGIKTPKRYKQIKFIDEFNDERHGLVVQKIKGAQDIRLTYKSPTLSLKVLSNSNNQTLKDIKHLQKIFEKNPNLSVSDLQGVVAEDGQFYIIDPLGINIKSSNRRNTLRLETLQAFEQHILKHHKRFTDKTRNHLTYVDKQLWESPDGALKQQMLSDAQKDENKVIVTYDVATGQKEVVHQPSDSQSLTFDTVEVITQDTKNQSVDLKKDCLDFAKEQSWKQSDDSVFRVNTPEEYEALNLKSNGKNKYNIILPIGEDEITKNAAESLYKKHPENSIIVTLNEQGKLVFPDGQAFIPDASVRINIVGFPEELEKVGAEKLANYTDEIVRHYDIDSVDSHAYLNRAALVGCNNGDLSENYAKQLYTRKYLRGASVTGRLSNMQINADGSKTMSDDNKKIIHNWNYENSRAVWTIEKSAHVGEVLASLKLGLGDTPPVDIPDSLTHEDLGKFINKGATKAAYTLKNYPNLLFLQLDANLKEEYYINQLKNEVDWVNKFREMGVKTPKYFKTLTMIGEDGQEHHGILVERIHDASLARPEDPVETTDPSELLKDERITHKTLTDIQNLLEKFKQHSNLSIGDLQVLMTRDGQLYVIDPLNAYTPSSKTLSFFSQQTREENIRNLEEWRDTSLSVLERFDQNKGMHAIFVDNNMLERDPEFEKNLLDKARKQQDLVVIGYNLDNTTKVLYEPRTDYEIDRVEVIVDKNNRFVSKDQMNDLIKENPQVSTDMVFRHALKKDFSNYRTNIIVQHGNSDTAIKAAQDLANKHPDNSIIVHFDADNKLVTSNNEFYTPKGNVRLSFVDHGGNFVTDESNMDNLIDKVKQINDTYGNENTYFERIALVGCDTDGVGKTLTKDFARAVYNNIPTLKNADITGRAGEVQVNDDGTKTMKTGGAKTVYSWHNGDIVSKTEDAKTTADKLKNPLSLTISDFISERMLEIDALVSFVKIPADFEFYKILSECKNYIKTADYKNMNLEANISFLEGIKERLSNFATPLPSMQAHIATLESYVAEVISRNEHRIEMNKKFPVSITGDNKIPNVIHYVWTGGAMPEPYLENIKAISRQNDKLAVRLHYDPNTLLINELKKRMQAHVDKNLPLTGNRMYEAVKLTKIFSNYCGDRDLSSDIIKRFMVDVLDVPIAEVNAIEGESEKYWNDFPGNNPKLALVPISFDDTELSGMKEAYQFELKNGSMAGASDAVRFSVLHTEGGVYTDVGLISNFRNRNNVLYDHIQDFPENGFPYKQVISIFNDAYPLVVNNNFLVAAPHSEFTGTMVQDISEAYNKITSDRVKQARHSYRSNQILDQYSTSIVPLGKFYLDRESHLIKKQFAGYFIDTRGSWQSSWNVEGIEFIVLIADTENLSVEQRRGLVDSIERNIDGYNNDAYKIVVLDSNTIINPVRREIVEHMNPFFTVQGVPRKNDRILIDYPELFARSKQIVVYDNNNNFKPMLTNFSDVVEHRNSSEFNKTIEGVVSARCFQVFLFDDQENFKKTIQELAPNISKENHVALVYDEANQKYTVLDNHNFTFKDGDRLKVNFIGELNNLDEAAEIQRKVSSAEDALPQIDIKKHTRETRVVLSKDIRFDQSLLDIKKVFSDSPSFYTHKGTAAIHAQNDEDKSNITILVNSKTGLTAVQDNETLSWETLTEFERSEFQRRENSANKSDNDSLNKYHNIVIQSNRAWRLASYNIAGDTNLKGKTSIVQVSTTGFRTIYGAPPSLITGDVRVVFAFDRNTDIVPNMNGISKALGPNAKIKDVRLVNRMEESVLQQPNTRSIYMEQVSRLAHRHKDAQIHMQQDMQTDRYMLRNYSYSLPYVPNNSSNPYQKNIIFKISDDSDIDKYADRMTIVSPNTSYVAILDPTTNIVRVYDSYGNIVTNANIHGEYEIHVLGRVSDLERIGSKGLSNHIISLQKSIKVKPKEKVSIKLTTCSTQESASNDSSFDANNHALSTVRQLKRYNKKVKISDNNANVVLDTSREGMAIMLHHLAETTPHQDTPLHNWADLSQEQINKLTTEAQKPQPSLANHD
ncbi:C80 family cysteine peptidase, partial [Bathymodiolus thermophilus thioautotrophic gill symbiont]